MANFHPELYARLYQLFLQQDPRVDLLQAYLTFAALSEKSAYPVTAKYHFSKIGIPMEIVTRSRSAQDLDAMARIETEALIEVERDVCTRFGL